MDQLFKLKDTVFGYLSPKRSAEATGPDPKRRRTVGPGTPSKDLAGEHAYDPISEPRGEKAQAALYRRVTTKFFARSDTNPRKRGREDEEDNDLVEGEQLIEGEEDVEMNLDDRHEVASSLGPEDSPSQITPNDDEEGEEDRSNEDDDGEEDEAEEYDGEDEVESTHDEEASAREKVQEYLARQAELALKKEAIEEVKLQGNWHPSEVFLFERLSLRSYEELIPQEWQIDFRTLPEDLFNENKKKVLINYNCSPSYHGVKALQPLLVLGMRVKEQSGVNGKATQYIAKALKDYIKWSEKDGGYFKKRFLPVLTVVTGKPNQRTDRISKAILDQMQFLAQKHRDFLALPEPRTNELGEVELYRRQPPLLYGIIVAQTIAIFVTLDSSKPEANLRHIAHFDFKEPKVDVWNGFALAIICVVARNYMMSIQDEFEEDDETESDPDA